MKPGNHARQAYPADDDKGVRDCVKGPNALIWRGIRAHAIAEAGIRVSGGAIHPSLPRRRWCAGHADLRHWAGSEPFRYFGLAPCDGTLADPDWRREFAASHQIVAVGARNAGYFEYAWEPKDTVGGVGQNENPRVAICSSFPVRKLSCPVICLTVPVIQMRSALVHDGAVKRTRFLFLHDSNVPEPSEQEARFAGG